MTTSNVFDSHFQKHVKGIKSVNVSSEMSTGQIYLLTAAIEGLTGRLGDVFQDEMEILKEAYSMFRDMSDSLPRKSGTNPVGRLRKMTETACTLIENRINRLKRAASPTY